jgi:MFS family permease
LWLKESPEELGMKPWGYTDEETPVLDDPSGALAKASAKEIVASRSFKLLMLMLFLMNASLVSMAALLATQHSDLGYKMNQITFLVSFYSMALIFVKVGAGILSDVLGMIKAFVVAVVSGCAGIALLGYGANYAIMLPAIVGVALGSTLNNVFPSLFASVLYDKRNYVPVFARLQSASMLGYACGFPVYGLVYDVTGNYKLAHAGAILVTAACLFLLPRILESSPQKSVA